MAYCKYCGKQIEEDSVFCSGCGKQINSKGADKKDNTLDGDETEFRLLKNESRKYDICISNGLFSISGDFWYLKDKNFYSSKGAQDTARTSDYIGCGYITKRSYRKCIEFVVWAVLFNVIKNIIDFICKFAETPKPLLIIYYIVIAICAFNIIRYFLDKKKIVDISFMNKRFAIPQNSINDRELHELKEAINKSKNLNS